MPVAALPGGPLKRLKVEARILDGNTVAAITTDDVTFLEIEVTIRIGTDSCRRRHLE